ncbi:Serine/threonine-protein phosphatase 7 long form [Glycine soja]
MLVSMASSSSYSSNIQIKSGPIDSDVLWMQPKHVSEHVWNGEEDRKLHIRRAVPTYLGEEEIPEEIIPLLRQSDFYWIMKMGYLKINASLITALIERWRPETHTFHMRCGECTITLQDVSILLGLHVDGAPLIGQTNLDWAELCEEFVVKLSWLAHHFLQINNHDGNVEQLQRFTRAWILRFIGGVLFVDKSSNKVSLRYLQFLRDFEQCSTYAWGPAVLAFLYREMCSATDYKIKSIGVFRRKLDIMKRHEGEVAEILQYMVSPQRRNTWTVDDLVPYVEKLTILSEKQERITEPVAHGPALEHQSPRQEFHMLQSSVETRGFDKRR